MHIWKLYKLNFVARRASDQSREEVPRKSDGLLKFSMIWCSIHGWCIGLKWFNMVESWCKFNVMARRASDQSREEEPGKIKPTMIEVSCLELLFITHTYRAWHYCCFCLELLFIAHTLHFISHTKHLLFIGHTKHGATLAILQYIFCLLNFTTHHFQQLPRFYLMHYWMIVAKAPRNFATVALGSHLIAPTVMLAVARW